MDKQTLIINYVHTITGGLITLEHAHADRILAIAHTQLPQSPYVKLRQYNAAKRSWELVCTMPVPLEAIYARLEEFSKRAAVQECYSYECYAADGSPITTINTGQAGLF